MYQYTVWQWMVCFYLYCFLGWCWESLYVSAKERRWVNRGFLRGPFLPIYGSGAVMMLVVSQPFSDNVVLTYLAGMVGATLLELVTGVVMEALFKVRYWDYSNQRFQYKGYICLSSSLAWGVFTVLMTRLIHPPIDRLLNGIPVFVTVWGAVILTGLFSVDFIVSFMKALNLRGLLDRMENGRRELALLQRRLDALIAFADAKEEAATEREQKLEELKEAIGEIRKKLTALPAGRKHSQLRRISNYPNMVSKKYRSALDEIKQYLADSKKK